MFHIDRQLVAVDCTRCGYPFEIQLLDASCQVRRRCPCCRIRIRFEEPDGSVSRGIADAHGALRDLERALGDLSL